MNRMWALVFFAAGVALLIYGIGLIRDARACEHWPQVSGKIISTEAQVVAKEKNKTTYAPSVTYRYEVAGKSYESSRVTLVPRNTKNRSSVEAMLAPYRVGDTAPVFHDPKDPANAILDTTLAGTEWAYAIGGVLLLGVGLFSLKWN